MDKDKIRFLGKTITIAHEFGGSTDGDGAQPFVDALYEEYTAAGKPDVTDWLQSRLATAFEAIGEPPRWIEQEPSWPYYGGRPMVFISQADLVENDVTARSLGYDQTVYLFGARSEVSVGGFELVYQTVTQIAGL